MNLNTKQLYRVSENRALKTCSVYSVGKSDSHQTIELYRVAVQFLRYKTCIVVMTC